MDASTLRQTIETYELQVKQVEQALEASGPDNAELIELRDNLLEVIELTNESLLALTKAEVLQSLESSPHDAGSSKTEEDEYAAFQAAMGTDSAANSPLQSNPVESGHSDSELSDHEESSNLDDIIGTCVMAPHSHSWGGYQYHNAAIIGLDADNGQVKVMFCQPTHISMKICPYHLQGECKYSESECRLSHGHLIDIDQLREYQPPDDRELSVGDNCLAKFSEDDLWYRATVVDTHGDEFLQVVFEAYGETTHAVQRCDVIPLASQSESSSCSSDEDQEQTIPQTGDDDVPNYLWKPSDGEQLAGWETHTRGIGSKLMAAMGYKSGEGLGKVSQGRVEPVPILKLPPGKSLDRIMALKEQTGNRDMFDVMKRKHHKLKLSSPSVQRPKKSADMFDYLNKSLGHGRKVDLTAYRKQRSKGACNERTTPSVISKHQLSKKTDKNVNIQVIQTEEEIAKVEQEMLSLKQRLEVNVSRRDMGGVKHLTDKLSKAEQYLVTLRRSHKELNRHRGQRESRKKLAIF